MLIPSDSASAACTRLRNGKRLWRCWSRWRRPSGDENMGILCIFWFSIFFPPSAFFLTYWHTSKIRFVAFGLVRRISSQRWQVLQGHNIIPCWRNDISLSHLSHPVTLSSADKSNQQLQQLYGFPDGRFGVVPWERERTQSEEAILDSDCITYNAAPGPNALLDSAAVHRSFMFIWSHVFVWSCGTRFEDFFPKRH